jgi:ligand-binding sensor domain-containing protein/signal transduction histidine kinase
MEWRSVLIAIVLPLCLEGELLPIRSYTSADGLAADSINLIRADARGFLWFCTPEGLTRFDGYRMISFGTDEGLPHRVVEAVLETRHGEYLVGTARGLCQFRAGGAGRFTTSPARSNRYENAVTALLEASSGRIWCGTAGGLFEVMSGLKFGRQLLPAPPPGWDRILVTDIVEDAGGKLWVGTNAGLYVIWQDGAVQRISRQDGLPWDVVNALLVDKTGRLWAGTRGGLALIRNGSANGSCGVRRVYGERQGLLASDVIALAEGVDGSLWIGTAKGISRLLPVSGQPLFQNLTRDNGLIDRRITTFATDKAGNMWAGTEGAGAMRIETAGFTTFRERDGLPSDRVWSVFGDRTGTVTAVAASETQKGWSVNIFDGVKFHAVAPKVFGNHPTWGSNGILLQSRAGEWWAATHTGLCRFAPVKASELAGRQPQACYAPELLVFQIFEDSKGGIWASAQSAQGDRLLRWDPGKKAITWFEKGPSRHELASAFAEDRTGNIWMGFWSGRDLIRYDGREFTRFKQRDGVPAGTIDALLIDSGGRLWIASRSGGLGLVENPGSAQFHLRAFNTGTGLASNSILCLVEDQIGRIYAGTQKGVDQLNPKTGHVKHFSVADGLAHGEMKSAFRDASGNLWFATTQGLSRLTPAADRPPSIPSVLITDLRIGRERYPVSERGESVIPRLRLQPSQNQIRVEFVGFNDEPGERLRYTYKLEGADSAWSPVRSQHEENYAALEPGDYRFLVKAVNSEDVESTSPAEIDFVILPPVWRRWWFETLALASLAGLVFVAHRYRVAQAVGIERIRTAIATDLHDDLGASLSQIAILSEVARTDVRLRQHGPNERLERVAALARELVDSMSDIVWSLRAEPDGVDSLIRRMREFAIDLLESQAIGFELRAPGNDAHLQLSQQTRRQLFLIFKECIHNAARHSGCRAVLAELGVQGREILLRVRDDGCGLNDAGGAPRKNGGTGIPSMKRRAESLGGSMEWTASPGGGCTVEVHVPIRRRAFGKSGR